MTPKNQSETETNPQEAAMAESLQPSFQRFHISQDELLESSSASPGNNNSGLGNTIPILDRTNEAKSHSLKLRDISPVCVLVVGMAGM